MRTRILLITLKKTKDLNDQCVCVCFMEGMNVGLHLSECMVVKKLKKKKLVIFKVNGLVL